MADATVLGVGISHPDKVLWPAHAGRPAITKLDHARYLEAVMERLLPHIAGRPCSIIRTPDGISSRARFLQRHAGAGTSRLIGTVKIPGDPDPYLQFDSPEAVIAAAQGGATEFHPWNNAPGRPGQPGRLVFDLDPDEALSFEHVVDAALEVKQRLEAVGLAAFLKTTGGKGLHVVTPLDGGGRKPPRWPAAKAFAKGLMARMAADSPQRYTAKLAKSARGGRIFLDYLRNDRMATAVAPLSARARPGAPVSFPLPWSQATAALDPGAFNLRTAVAGLSSYPAWNGYEAASGSLADAMTRLNSSN